MGSSPPDLVTVSYLFGISPAWFRGAKPHFGGNPFPTVSSVPRPSSSTLDFRTSTSTLVEMRQNQFSILYNISYQTIQCQRFLIKGSALLPVLLAF